MHLSRLAVRGLRGSADGELEAVLPGRFAVLVGANSAGKTTFSDAAYLAHPQTFPTLPPLSAAALGSGDRSVDVEYRLERAGHTEGSLGLMVQTQSGALKPGDVAATWRRTFSRRLGVIRAHTDLRSDLMDHVKLLYLPAWRNPIDELARREARILVELLRAQQQRLKGSRSLTDLRLRAWGLLERLSDDPLIQAVEERITTHLSALTAGVSRQWPYVRGQRVDDAYLARVLELMLAVIEGRPHARPLEVTGLGYVNLLHVAVTLAAIPDPAAIAAAGATADDDGSPPGEDGETADAADNDPISRESRARSELVQAREDAELAEDSLFQEAPFHATIIIEEPEAHLHPQLQHALTRHLRRTVDARPELQVVISSHAPDVITSAQPEDIVVLRRQSDGRRVSRAVANIPLDDRAKVLRSARLHLDGSRSASLFAERLLLVEGVTDAALVREFGWVWAANDADKQAFIDALTIVPMGTRVGPWPVRLLATTGYELCERPAILSDSDKELHETPTSPSWLTEHNAEVVRLFHSHPTLEPSVTAGNESLVGAALDNIDLSLDSVSVETVHLTFRGARKAKDGRPATSAGPGVRRKGEFALALAEQILLAREAEAYVDLPSALSDLFDFLYGTQPAATTATPVATPDNPIA